MTLVAAAMDVPPPAGVRVVKVESTDELHRAMLEELQANDVVVRSAAVADFRPQPAPTKIKKTGDNGVDLHLEQTTDVLADLVARRSGQVIVGFAAETAGDDDELLELGRQKLARKGCDLLVINEVGRSEVFGSDQNSVRIIDHTGLVGTVDRQGKAAVADAVWDAVRARLTRA